MTKALWCLLRPPAQETLRQLVQHGPIWDGDIVSKASRDDLFRLGLAARACVKGEQGYAVANHRGWDVWKQSQ